MHGGTLAHKHVTEDATGWEEGLYTQPALPHDLAQVLEQRLFDYLDRRAAKALTVLGRSPHGPLEPDQHRAWSQFLIAYHLRHPDAFAEIKAAATSEWDRGDAAAQEKYARTIRRPNDPESLGDYLAACDSHLRAKAITRLLITTIDNQRLGPVLEAMEWHVVNLSNAGRRLLTSDRALQIGPLKDGNGFVSMPISPTQLFLAVQKPELARRVASAQPRNIVIEVNKWVVSRARRYVWAADRAADRFVERYIAKNQEPVPLFPNLARGRPATD